jgi:hypothetical protein
MTQIFITHSSIALLGLVRSSSHGRHFALTSLRFPFSCSCQIVIGKEDISDVGVGVGVTAAARGGGSRLNSGLRKLVVYLCQLVLPSGTVGNRNRLQKKT